MSKPRNYRIWGGPGTTKSSFTFSPKMGKKSVWYGEFDPGSFDRANFPDEEIFDLHKYRVPLKFKLDLGMSTASEKGGVAPQNLRKIEGMSELCDQITADLIAALESEAFSRYVFDTETAQWAIAQAGHNQQEQNSSGDERRRLDQLHYTEPNRWMDGWIGAPQSMERTLVILCQEKEKFGSPGVYIPDGYKGTGALVDLSMRFFVQNRHAIARIDKTGAGGLDLMDMEIVDPTFEKIDHLVDCAEAIRRMKIPMPTDYAQLIEKGGKLL